MNDGSLFKSIILSLIAGAVIVGLTPPANAQYFGEDSHASKAVSSTSLMIRPVDSYSTARTVKTSRTSSDLPADLSGVVPVPEGSGTVKVNNLAMLEALINICANGAEMVCFLWGAGLIFACLRKIGKPGLARSFAIALIPIILGLCTPPAFNWAIDAVGTADIFS